MSQIDSYKTVGNNTSEHETFKIKEVPKKVKRHFGILGRFVNKIIGLVKNILS